MPNIAVLPSAVADQIAAGEVVERPASVVKELVENALDAGATSVEIAIEEGGKRLVRVADDGSGMSAEDARLALARHATSKIRTAADLIGVSSFGFRGEALAAISSVSQLELLTADSDGEGVVVLSDGGTVTDVRPASRRRGTTVQVRTLFHNVPARQKFLRGTRSEWRAIADTVTTMALVRRDVRFVLSHDGKEALLLPAASSLRARVAAVWGNAYAESLLAVDDVTGPVHVSGLVERPADVGSRTRRVHLVVNGRAIRDTGVVRAVEAAYRTTIPAGVRPSMILELVLPADALDVNVHPAKVEVRFHDRWEVERAVERAVRRALGVMDSAPWLGGPPSRGTAAPGGPGPGQAGVVSDLALLSTVPVPGDGLFAGNESGASWADAAGQSDSAPLSGAPDDTPEPGGYRDGSSGSQVTVGAAGAGGDDASSGFGSLTIGQSQSGGAVTTAPAPEAIPPLLQLRRTYMMFERADGVVLIDQHAAHERVLYERFMGALERGESGVQQLLLPLTLHLGPAEADAFDSNRQFFEQLGFEIEGFGGNTLIVSAVPWPHPRFDAERCLRETLDSLTGDRIPGVHARHELLAATVACKAAVKAGDALSQDEMRALYRDLRRCTLPAHDVHGRAVLVHLSWDELERRFGRR